MYIKATEIMIIPEPINWEAKVWEMRYYLAMSLVHRMLENDLGEIVGYPPMSTWTIHKGIVNG